MVQTKHLLDYDHWFLECQQKGLVVIHIVIDFRQFFQIDSVSFIDHPVEVHTGYTYLIEVRRGLVHLLL